MTAYYLTIGTGQAKNYPIGNKAALLDRARQAGLAVPDGVIVLDEAWQKALDQQLITVNQQTISIVDSNSLLALLNLPSFSKPVAVRSAFAAEDRADASLAGYFHSELFVDANNADALAAAIGRVWESALKRQGNFRRDVLIMTMVNPQQAGVAFTEPDFADDLVNFTTGTADKLVGGQVEGETLQLPKIESLNKVNYPWPPFGKRLQTLLRHVRRVFGNEPWDIEWADDGQHCWLVQIRPITRPPRRNEAFTYANIREIMPDPPSPFMTSIVAACADGLYAYYRSFDPTLPKNRPLIEIFADRPLFNISLLTDTMRHWGLSTKLVTNSIGGDADREFGFNLSRFLQKTFVLLRQGWAQLTAVGSAQKATKTILNRTKNPGNTLSECANTLQWLFTFLVTEMFNLTAALSGPLLILRLTNTLTQHNARQRSISTEMYLDLAPLRQLVKENPSLKTALENGQVPNHPLFQKTWQRYLDKHGHRGVYESDIERPRYHETPEPLLISLSNSFNNAHEKQLPPYTLMGHLTRPIWWQCRRVLDAREWWRYNAMICYDRIRQQMLSLAEPLVENGILPSADHMWSLTQAELNDLENGWVPDDDFWEQRQQKRDTSKTYNFPDLIYRFDNLETFQKTEDVTSTQTQLRGVSLTAGTVQGKALILSEPTTTLPEGFSPDSTILIARSVDAGWIPTFSLVAGVVVEIGGDLSHGSIILREIGLPAVTNVRYVTQTISDGATVLLDASSGLVKIHPQFTPEPEKTANL